MKMMVAHDGPNISPVDSLSNEEFEELKLWLKYNKEPVPEVIDNWRKTSKLRLKELQTEKYSNIRDMVNDWPSYKLSFGYKLIELDFATKFIGSELLLFKKWPNFLDKALVHFKTIKAASDYIKLIEENPSEAGELHGAAFWAVVVGAAGAVVTVLAVFACWVARRRNSLAHKLGGKRGPDKALVFQPPRRATAVRSPGSATHYLRKSPSPTAPAPATAPAGTPPQPHPPSGATSPHTPTAPPTEPLPLSKELADPHATEIPNKPQEPETNEGKLGDLHFKLRYENEKSALVVSVVSCQNLPGREPAGPDPYVKLQLLPDKQHKVKTRVVRKTRCPVYDEDFTFYGLSPNQLSNITLHFVVLSFDRYSRDEIIGEVVAPLSSLQLASGEAMALCREIQPRSLKMRSLGRGEVLVSLCWQPAAARLTVVLLKARNLPKMDVTGLADPYVKMYLLYNGQRIAKKKTHVKKRTLNPVFNESFVFEVPAAPTATLDHVSLELLVLDWDRVTKNEVIGRLELGAEGIGSARHHWREVQAAPRRQIADWHKLKE